MKRIANLRDEGVTFLESGVVKYEEDIAYILFEDIMNNVPIITQRKIVLIGQFLEMKYT